MIEQGADFNRQYPSGWTIAFDAVMSGSVELLEYLIEKNILDTKIDRLLNIVCKFGHTPKVEVLLKSKAQDEKNKKRLCLLAASQARSPKIIEFILEYCSKESTEYIRELVIVLVHNAIKEKNYKLIELILNKIKIDLVELYNHLSSLIEYNDYKVLNKFLKMGDRFSITQSVKSNCGYLHNAIQDGNLKITKKFMKLGFDYKTQSKERTVLHSAVLATSQNYKVLQYLLTLEDVDINARDTSGCTALLYAVAKNKLVETYLLLQKGSNVNLSLNNNLTLLHAVCDTANLDLFNMLVHFGVNSQIENATNDEVVPIDMIWNQQLFNQALIMIRRMTPVHLMDAISVSPLSSNRTI